MKHSFKDNEHNSYCIDMTAIKYLFYILVGLSVISLGLLSIVIFEFGSDWDCFVGDSNHNYMPSRPLHDELMVKTGETYQICYNLKNLEENVLNEEANSLNITKYYKLLLDKGNLHCGRIRVKDNMFDLKLHFTTKFDCTQDIIAAKRRLFTYIKQLCYQQKDAHNKHHRRLRNTKNQNLNRSQSHDAYIEQNNTSTPEAMLIPVSMKENVTHLLITSKDKVETYGVVYTGKASHFKKIYQSIIAHRHFKMNLRIEVWSSLFDSTFCLETIGLLENVHCLSLPSNSNGFVSKFYALLLTRLHHAVFMDADNLAVRNVQEIFDSVEYEKTGFVMWPDLCGHRCKSVKVNLDCGFTSYNSHVLWAAHFGGLKWDYKRVYAQEAETGQIAVDLSRHAGLINFGRQWMEDNEFLVRVVYGDKDVFRFVFLIMGKSFHFVPMIPGVSVDESGARDSLVHYWPVAPSLPSSSTLSSSSSALSRSIANNKQRLKSNGGDMDKEYNYQPMFFHQLKLRHANTFLRMDNVPYSSNKQPSACFTTSGPGVYSNESEADHSIRRHDLNNPDNSRLPLHVRSNVQRGEEFMQFAQYVFDKTDKEWSELQKKLAWKFRWKEFVKNPIAQALGLQCIQ